MLFLLAPAGPALALDCWAPTREQQYVDGRVTITSPEVAPMRRALLAADEIVQRNPHFRGMPREIRIRTSISIGGGAPRYGQLNAVAYRPDVWAPGACDLLPGADRCCTDGNITIVFNDARGFLTAAGKDDVLEMFEQPELTGRVAGYPEYNGMNILLSVDGKVPWTTPLPGCRDW